MDAFTIHPLEWSRRVWPNSLLSTLGTLPTAHRTNSRSPRKCLTFLYNYKKKKKKPKLFKVCMYVNKCTYAYRVVFLLTWSQNMILSISFMKEGVHKGQNAWDSWASGMQPCGSAQVLLSFLIPNQFFPSQFLFNFRVLTIIGSYFFCCSLSSFFFSFPTHLQVSTRGASWQKELSWWRRGW